MHRGPLGFASIRLTRRPWRCLPQAYLSHKGYGAPLPSLSAIREMREECLTSLLLEEEVELFLINTGLRRARPLALPAPPLLALPAAAAAARLTPSVVPIVEHTAPAVMQSPAVTVLVFALLFACLASKIKAIGRLAPPLPPLPTPPPCLPSPLDSASAPVRVAVLILSLCLCPLACAGADGPSPSAGPVPPADLPSPVPSVPTVAELIQVRHRLEGKSGIVGVYSSCFPSPPFLQRS